MQVHSFERSGCRIIIIIIVFDGRDFTRVPVTNIGQKSSLYLKRGLVFDNRVAFGNFPASDCLCVSGFVGVRRLLFVLRCTWRHFAGKQVPKKSQLGIAAGRLS